MREKLAGIEEERSVIQDELDSLKDAKDQVDELLSLRDDLMERARNGFFERATTTPEQRHDLYRKLGLRVELDDDGNPVLTGAFDLFSKEQTLSADRTGLTP